ncbi:hypothetical protein DEO72_LG4g256 [Vigna unguiculata]|uniref:Uncharacterized protein n=1 Tax=Vigna unguiculata TaxID=3917 RepID=A0A4D6LKP1_VIGUN|nr:hypothetical protein DEO72_LG4g256 [Vigna unguiculata]
MVLREWSADSMKRWWRCRSAFSAAMAAALVVREEWCDGDAVVAGEVRRCGGGYHGGGMRKEN